MALFDYDNDGRVDMYFVDALTVETAHDPKSARSVLYRNLGGNRFEDVTDTAGVAHPGWGMGACTADVDGDGWEDLYVTNLGPNALYRNNGDGTFTDIAAEAGVAAGGWSMGCGFADYDRDGDVDLFVSRYVKLDLEHLPEFGKGGPGMKGTGRGADCQYRGVAVQCGPRGLPGEGDLFFRNLGDGRFEEVSAQVGADDPHRYFGLGIAWFDADEDGWLDLFVSNDAGPNFLYVNQKNGTFKDSAFPAGVAVSEDGAEQGCMGVAVGGLRERRALQPLRDELRRGVQRLLPQRRQLLHGLVLPHEDGPEQPPLRRAGGSGSSTTTTTAGRTSSSATATSTPSSTRPSWGRRRPTGSGGCCTTTAATGPSRRWPSSSGRPSPSRGSAVA